jgi:hypothetical protein
MAWDLVRNVHLWTGSSLFNEKLGVGVQNLHFNMF